MSCPLPQDKRNSLAGKKRASGKSLTAEERAARAEANRNAPLHLRANSIQAEQSGVTELDGYVELIRGTDRITADHLRYEKPTDTAEARGNVQYRNANGDTFYTRDLQLQLDTHLGEAGLTRFTVANERGRGDAQRIEFQGPDNARLDESRFTTCREGQDDWFLKVRRLDLDHDEDIGTAHNATVEFFGVPLFYLPYLSFPISNERKSGFLIPGIGRSDRHGFVISAPYYFNLAPNYDATVTPRVLSERGLQLQNQFRYLTENSTGKLEIDTLQNDRRAQKEGLEEDDRSSGYFLHQQTFNPLWAGKIDLRGASDKEYFRDYGDRLSLTSQSFLPQLMETVYRGPQWMFATRLTDHQVVDRNIAPDARPYARLPQLQLASSALPRPNRLHPQFESEWSRFEHSHLLNGERLNVHTGLSLPLENAWSFLTPKVGARYTGYRLDRQDDATPALVRGSVSLDSGLFFERETGWSGRDTIQTLEPRLFYLYVPYKNQDALPNFDSGVPDLSFASLFRENRFTGGDRIGDTNQITTAMTTRFLDAEEGIERLRFSLGRIYYFTDPEVNLPAGTPDRTQSDLVAEVSAWLIDNWHARETVLWNNGDRRADRSSTYLQYHPARNKIFNIGYVFVRDQIGQYDVSAEWPLFGRWSVRGRSLRSERDDRNVETYAGIEYNACCWALRVVAARRFQDPDQDDSIMFELQLTGLSKLGGVPDSPLKQGLFSFNDGRKDDPVAE